jgi:hypothetical protein
MPTPTLTPTAENVVNHAVTAYAGPFCGSFQHLTASTTANGTFTIPDVPAGPYYLFIDSDVYVISSRTPEVGAYTLGRADSMPATQTTNITLAANGLIPWATGDAVQIVSFTANWAAFGIGTSVNATTLSDVYNWATFDSPPYTLLTTADTLYFLQLVSHPTPVAYKALASLGSVVPSKNMVNGQTSTLTAAMTAIPASQMTSHTLSWNIPAFAAYGPVVHPQATLVANAHQYDVRVLGAPPSYGFFGSAPDLMMMAFPSGTAPVDVTVAYGNPFPEPSAVFCEAQTFWTIDYALSGAAAVPVYYPMLTRDPTCPDSVVPTLSPPQNVTIDGSPWYGSITSPTALSTDAPTVTWGAPALGTPTRYDLTILELKVSTANKTEISNTQVLHTQGTSVVIPPSMLKSGATYVFVLQSTISCPEGMCDQFPARYALPSAYSPTFSGLYQAH